MNRDQHQPGRTPASSPLTHHLPAPTIPSHTIPAELPPLPPTRLDSAYREPHDQGTTHVRQFGADLTMNHHDRIRQHHCEGSASRAVDYATARQVESVRHATPLLRPN